MSQALRHAGACLLQAGAKTGPHGIPGLLFQSENKGLAGLHITLSPFNFACRFEGINLTPTLIVFVEFFVALHYSEFSIFQISFGETHESARFVRPSQ
ncbi:hypothetical protein [Massilia sp. BJB1822]|uniref:hypothetical protein n=1 Tax=Massilia sp. BJB1822 TaxID=2744470 RepID=UPI001594B300|nr:hypothetical protein [Massilia sp. BJB1822]NVD96571.1 hypothetical protein [Massilia sp. BJB1822]